MALPNTTGLMCSVLSDRQKDVWSERFRMDERFEVMKARVDMSATHTSSHRKLPFAALKRLIADSLFRHNILLFAANMAVSALNYLFYPVVGHLLGGEGLGILASLGAISIIFLIPTQIVANVANKFTADLIAQDRVEQVNYLLRQGSRYALGAGVLTAIAFIILSPTLSTFLNLPSSQYIVIMSVGFVLSFASPVTVGVIQGRQQFEWFAFINLLTVFLRVASAAVAVRLGWGLSGILWAGLVAGIVVYVLSFVPLRDILRRSITPFAALKPLFGYSLGATAMISGGLLLVNTDTILVRHFLPRQSGYYAALTTTGRIVLFIGGSLIWVMFPKVATLHQQGRSHVRVLAWTMAGVLALSASVVAVFRFFPNQILTLILHVPAVVSQQLFWYGLSMLLLALANVLMYYFLSLGRMAFVPVLLLCCALQAITIIIWHSTITQVVTIMIAVTGLLLCGLVVILVMQETGASYRRQMGERTAYQVSVSDV